jgi:Spy/CpxP family protein refolding chaperone
MRRRTWFKRIGIGLLGLTGIVSLAAFRGGGMHGHGPGGFFGARMEAILEDVDATDEQRAQVRAIVDRLREEGKALRSDRGAEHEQLVAKWEAGTLDRAQIVAHMDARAEQMKAFGHEVADAMVEVQGILTPEQRAEVAKKMRSHTERRERRGPRGGPAN